MTTAEADQLRRRLITATEPDEVLRELDRLDASGSSEVALEQPPLELKYAGLRALQGLLADDAKSARPIIIERLLPLCLLEAEQTDLKRNVIFINCRSLAGEWLNVLGGPGALETTEAALTFLMAQLDVERTCLPALLTLSEIGFRTLTLTESLWKLTLSDDLERRDAALATLVTLGLSGDERQRCLTMALAAARERLPYTICNVLMAIPAAETISILAEAWLDRPLAELEPEAASLWPIFARVAARLTDARAIDLACDAISRLIERLPSRLARAVRLASNSLPHMDSPRAAGLLIRMLAQETDATVYDRWLVMLRLGSCCRPLQLVGMESAAARDPMIVATLRSAVLERGEHLGRDATHEGHVKVSALETALLLGIEEVTTWLEPALEQEANPYRQHELLQAFAQLRVNPLPEKIRGAIVEEIHLGRADEDNIELFRRLAASRVARSAATWEAFDVLSRPGLLRDGAVMMETAQGLIDATLSIGADVNLRPAVIERLFASVEKPNSVAQLAAACHALAAAARCGWLSSGNLPTRLLAALRSEPSIPLQPFHRAMLVGAVSELPRATWPDWLSQQLVCWTAEDGQLGESAVRALISMGCFAEHAESLAPKLGIHRAVDECWHWSADAKGQIEWAPLGVVLLYGKAPERFEPALCDVFADERWFVRHDAPGLLLWLVRENRATMRPAIGDALIARVLRRQSSRQADPALLRQTAQMIPKRFAQVSWSKHHGDWMEDARTALADALGVFPPSISLADPQLRSATAKELLILARDGRFVVRRSAYRSLGRVHAGALASFCASLSESSEVAERTLAAEAWAWLPVTDVRPSGEAESSTSAVNIFSPNAESLSRQFAADPSRHVRKTEEMAGAARERRAWAESYRLQLAMLRAPDNSGLLHAWKLGNALAQTGDDETLRLLCEHLESATLSPALRFRLRRVAKELEKKWNAVTQKWPQPSRSLPGGIETLTSRLRSRGGEWSVHCTLWHSANSSTDADQRWGGIAVIEHPGDPFSFLSAFADMQAELLSEGVATRIAVLSVEGNGSLAFHGLGNYPPAQNSASGK